MDTYSLLRTLKVELKRSRISYRDLAKELKISEAGVKKILTRDDLSLERAFQICRVLNLSFAELVSRSEEAKSSVFRFTDRQVEFLKKNTSYFYFYMKLAYEQKTPLEIQAENGLSVRSLNAYLKKLEELGLIKRHPKDRAQIVGGTPLHVSTQGTALEAVKFEIMGQLLAHFRRTGEGFLGGGSFLLTTEESEELDRRMAELIRDYTLLTRKNRKIAKAGLAPLSVMFVRVPTGMFSGIGEV